MYIFRRQVVALQPREHLGTRAPFPGCAQGEEDRCASLPAIITAMVMISVIITIMDIIIDINISSSSSSSSSISPA